MKSKRVTSDMAPAMQNEKEADEAEKIEALIKERAEAEALNLYPDNTPVNAIYRAGYIAGALRQGKKDEGRRMGFSMDGFRMQLVHAYYGLARCLNNWTDKEGVLQVDVKEVLDEPMDELRRLCRTLCHVYHDEVEHFSSLSDWLDGQIVQEFKPHNTHEQD